MHKLFVILLSITFLYSCSPVRTRDYNKSQKAIENSQGKASPNGSANTIHKANTQSNDANHNDIKPIFKRFSDTTFVYLGEYKEPIKHAVKATKVKNKSLEQAIKNFDDGKTKEACEEIVKILSTMSKDSEDYTETLFYTSECYLVKNQFEPARKILIDLIGKGILDDDLNERAIVRLGQIYCVETEFDKATMMFEQLAKKYPKSIYLPVANCDVIEKK